MAMHSIIEWRNLCEIDYESKSISFWIFPNV